MFGNRSYTIDVKVDLDSISVQLASAMKYAYMPGYGNHTTFNDRINFIDSIGKIGYTLESESRLTYYVLSAIIGLNSYA